MHEYDILLNFSNGDPEAFRFIYNRYHTHIFLLANRYLKQEDDAKDIRSACFIKLWEARDKLKFETMASLYGWLRTAAINSSIDLIRMFKLHAAKHEAIEYEIIIDQRDVFEVTDKEAAIINRALNNIDKLPGMFKEVFRMRYYDELKFTEIAKILNTNVSTIKKRYARALELIKDI